MRRRRRGGLFGSPGTVLVLGPLDDLTAWTPSGLAALTAGPNGTRFQENTSTSAHEATGAGVLPLVAGKRYTTFLDYYKLTSSPRPALWFTVAYGGELHQAWFDDLLTTPVVGYSGGLVSASVGDSPADPNYVRCTMVWDAINDGVNANVSVSMDDGAGSYSYLGASFYIEVKRLTARRTA